MLFFSFTRPNRWMLLWNLDNVYKEFFFQFFFFNSSLFFGVNDVENAEIISFLFFFFFLPTFCLRKEKYFYWKCFSFLFICDKRIGLYLSVLATLSGGYFHRNAIRGCAAQMGWFFDKKSLNMGPIFDPQIPKHGSIFRQNFQKIPKHGSIFWAKSLNMGTFFTSKHGLGSRGPGGTPPSKTKSSTPRDFVQALWEHTRHYLVLAILYSEKEHWWKFV